MSRATRKTTDRLLAALSLFIYRLAPKAGRFCVSAVCGLFSTRFAVTLCVALLAFQIVILGIGVTGKLEQSHRAALDVAKLNMAAIEARELAKALSTHGTQITASAQSAPRDEAADTPPPLKPRPVEAILMAETGYSPIPTDSNTTSTGDTSGSNTNSGHPAPDAAPASATPGNPAAPTAFPLLQTPQDTPLIIENTKLSEDQIRELDTHIRAGVTAMIEGDMRLCILKFEAAYAIFPDHPALLYYLGMAYDKLLNPNKAREYYTRVFQMREKAGPFFQRASRRLTYGLAMPSDMRGKLAFGPFQMQHEYDVQNGETVHILLPILLAPGEEVRAEDLKIDVQVFDLLNGRKIEFNRLASPTWAWEHETQDFDNHEENLFITYHIPALTQEQIDVYGEVRYYGFTAKLYYKGEPLDCISSPSALILHEQILNSRRSAAPAGGLLPDDGLAPAYEEAEPVSDFTDNFLY